MKLSPEALASVLDLPTPTSSLPPATGVAFHSGRVRPGDAFFALPGATTHGIRFADEALAAGAAFVVSDRPHSRGLLVPDAGAALLALGRHARSEWPGTLVAITGSAGKTSTKELLAAALDASRSEGNLNTPYALAAKLVDTWLGDGDAGHLVLEVGIDHAGEMAILADLVSPDVAVLTLVGHAHLDGLGSLERVAQEKSRLLRAARRRFASAQAYGHLADDLRDATSTYGIEPDRADLVGRIVSEQPDRQAIAVGEVTLELRQVSRALAANAVGAFAVATALGVSPGTVAERLARAARPPGRLQPRPWGRGIVLDDTYNSNPASAANALDALRRHPRPHVAVLGDMLELGPLSEMLHRELGAATIGLDRVLAFGPESRAIAQGNPRAEHFATFEELAEALRSLPREGTVLLKASRGMRLERAADVLMGDVPR